MEPLSGDEARATSRRIIEAADSARRELARDLHDGAQQQLVVCVTQLQRAAHKWSTDPARAKELLDDGVAAAQAALTGLRELAAGIHPPLLVHRGLGAAVEELASGQPLPVAQDLTDARFPPPFEASVYFLVCEALSNVVKHADASRAFVRISVDGGRLTVEVTDDGVGGARATTDGVGLLGLAERVAALDGKFTVTSDAHSGTSVIAEMPVPEPDASEPVQTARGHPSAASSR
jgi:signal transduction histidine kinase